MFRIFRVAICPSALQLFDDETRSHAQLRTSKNDTVREIALYASPDLLLPTSPIAAALPEIQHRLTTNLSSLSPLDSAACSLPGVIRFKRHLQARWDQPTKRFVPLTTPRWEWDPTTLVVLTADELVDKISGMSEMLIEWSRDVRSVLDLGSKEMMMILVKGLKGYYAKTKTLKNREFTAAARAGLGNPSGATGKSSGRVEQDVVEREMARLQVEEGCYLIHGQLPSA